MNAWANEGPGEADARPPITLRQRASIPARWTLSDKVRFATLTDPDGNEITLAEPR